MSICNHHLSNNRLSHRKSMRLLNFQMTSLIQDFRVINLKRIRAVNKKAAKFKKLTGLHFLKLIEYKSEKAL